MTFESKSPSFASRGHLQKGRRRRPLTCEVGTLRGKGPAKAGESGCPRAKGMEGAASGVGPEGPQTAPKAAGPARPGGEADGGCTPRPWPRSLRRAMPPGATRPTGERLLRRIWAEAEHKEPGKLRIRIRQKSRRRGEGGDSVRTARLLRGNEAPSKAIHRMW